MLHDCVICFASISSLMNHDCFVRFILFFLKDPPPPEIYPLPQPDPLPISAEDQVVIERSSRHAATRGTSTMKPKPFLIAAVLLSAPAAVPAAGQPVAPKPPASLKYLRSEEHTSELQSQSNLVCRLLLETKK